MNVKSLAAESKIIRLEEKKASKVVKYDGGWHWPSHCDRLYSHRTYTVRRQSRVAQLLYAFVRGKKRIELESKIDPHKECGLEMLIKKKAKKHGIETDGLADWLTAR